MKDCPELIKFTILLHKLYSVNIHKSFACIYFPKSAICNLNLLCFKKHKHIRYTAVNNRSVTLKEV